MKTIYYRNLTEKQLKALKSLPEDFSVTAYDHKAFFPDEAGLLVLGDEMPNLIPCIQEISKKDPDVGVLVIASDPLLKNQLGVAIQFAPFVSPHVHVVNLINGGELRDLVVQEAGLTITRKKFKRTKDRVLSNIHISLDAQVKSSFFDQFLAEAPVGVVLLCEELVVLDANNYVTKFFGENVELKSSYFPAVFEGNEVLVEKLLRERVMTEERTTIAVRLDKKKIRHIQLYTSEVVSADSAYKMVILLDVTREVIAEQRVQDYLRKLEKHNKELEQFAQILSHDLKSPLSTIKLSYEMASKGQPRLEKSNLVEIMYRSANNLHQMIEGLEEIIDVRKNGKTHPFPVHFAQVMNNVLNTYQIHLEQQDIEIISDFQNEPAIKYVESYLTSILHNLISNCIKYRKEKEPLKIRVSTEKSGGYTLLKVADNGIGIDMKKHHSNLFQPFRRFTAQAQGRGIGLSIIKSMIEKNNGKIRIESAVGVGTTFYCYLCPYE